jgi:hypothetical protein
MLTTPVLMFCVALGGLPIADDLQLSRARGFSLMCLISVAEVGPETPAPDNNDDKPDTPPDGKCTCNGTGRVRSGDGLVDVPCPCGKNCQCTHDNGTGETCNCGGDRRKCTCRHNCQCRHDQGAAAGVEEALPTRQGIVFVADWCAPACPKIKKQVKALRANNWPAGDDPDDLVRLVDIDVHPELVQQYAVETVPQLVVLENGVVAERYTAEKLPSTAFGLADLISGPPVTTPTTRAYRGPTGKKYTQQVPSVPPVAKAAPPAQPPVSQWPAQAPSGNCANGSCAVQPQTFYQNRGRRWRR